MGDRIRSIANHRGRPSTETDRKARARDPRRRRLHNYAAVVVYSLGMPQGSPLRAAVVGSTGYIGMQCTALLAAHPDVELIGVHARSNTGKRYRDVVPGSTVELTIDDTLDPGAADVVVAALPHTVAARLAPGWLAHGATVIDCSADFRLHDPAAYAAWYGVEHPTPDLLDEAVYAMVELSRERLSSANLISVPGCYPTATLLACVPALRAGVVERDIVVDAKSGVSGAGREARLGNSFSEVNESVHAYGVEGHRHKSEMLEQLHDAAGADVRLTLRATSDPDDPRHPRHGVPAPAPGRHRSGVARRSTRTSARPAPSSISSTHPLRRKSVTGHEPRSDPRRLAGRRRGDHRRHRQPRQGRRRAGGARAERPLRIR